MRHDLPEKKKCVLRMVVEYAPEKITPDRIADAVEGLLTGESEPGLDETICRVTRCLLSKDDPENPEQMTGEFELRDASPDPDDGETRPLRFRVGEETQGAHIVVLDDYGNDLCRVVLDYFLNRLSVLAWERGSEDDPDINIPLVEDVEGVRGEKLPEESHE